jgi:hypothetical protein
MHGHSPHPQFMAIHQVPPPTVRPCNRVPCPSSISTWAVGSWGPCSAVQDPHDPCSAAVGTQQRRVTCQSADGSLMPQDACNGTLGAPPAMQPCTLPPLDSCACQRDQDCASMNTVCNTTSAQCVCATGWGGDSCSVPLLLQVACEDGVVDYAGTCCEGYIDSMSGLCCPQDASVDARGVCCPLVALDACGVCNGTGVAVGLDGACCNSPLPPSGMCCGNGGRVDSCGVCGGDNRCRWDA